MAPRSSRRPFALLATLLAIAAGGCSENDPNDGVDAEDIQTVLEDSFDNIPLFVEALERLVLTLSGTPQPGVSVSPGASGASGSVSIDLDGNGSREMTVTGLLSYNDPGVGIAGGANIGITGITGTTGTASLSGVIVPSGGDFFAVQGSGSFTPDEGPEVDITLALIEGDLSDPTPVLDGSVQFAIGEVTGIAVIEPDGAGSFRIRVSGETFDEFIVP